jgi:hypothetical protein
MMLGKYVYTLLMGVACLAWGMSVHAQSPLLNSSTREGPSHISLKPQYPAPGAEVTARLNAHMIYAPSARIVWKKDGVIVQEKLGGIEYTFTTGKVGTPISLEVIVYEESGNIIRKTLSQTVGAVSIIWEARTYTPPLYQGRALYSPDSEVVLQALPIIANGKGGFLDTKDMVFNWRLHGETNPRHSGQGLDSITAKGKTPFIPLSATVQIQDKLGKTLAIGQVKVPITYPEVLFYESNPLTGLVRTKAIASPYFMRATESTLYAEPYYMSAPTRTDPALVYEWRVGSQKLSLPGKITMRPEGVGAGNARIETTVTHRIFMSQRARGDSTIRFQATNNSNSAQDPTTEPF